MSRPEEEYREFVGSRAASLHRTAYLLCGDWHLADDLVQETFVKAFRHPQVRAGVLRLVSALPGVNVTRATVDGQPALTLTAGAAELGRVLGKPDKANPKGQPGAAYSEAITVNANTGLPLQIASGVGGKVTGITSYVVTRINLADIAAGKL